MTKYHIDVFYSEDDGGYIANIPDLQHCSAFGETPQDALREVLAAQELWLETARENGFKIPDVSYSPLYHKIAQ
ncbi:MAG: type II toxin-antitoxin system HicB family antitoxin [Spirochaetes bacterium]|nr:type II toxin-antitoxin system HicB family antitoxin [Spirochaetota bacterium]